MRRSTTFGVDVRGDSDLLSAAPWSRIAGPRIRGRSADCPPCHKTQALAGVLKDEKLHRRRACLHDFDYALPRSGPAGADHAAVGVGSVAAAEVEVVSVAAAADTRSRLRAECRHGPSHARLAARGGPARTLVDTHRSAIARTIMVAGITATGVDIGADHGPIIPGVGVGMEVGVAAGAGDSAPDWQPPVC